MEPSNGGREHDRGADAGLPEPVNVAGGDPAEPRAAPPLSPATPVVEWRDAGPAPMADPTVADAVGAPARAPRRPTYRRPRSLRRRAGLVLLLLLVGAALGWVIAGMPR